MQLLTMADDADNVFVASSIVNCVTCYGETIEGEVIAFDYQKRILILSKSIS